MFTMNCGIHHDEKCSMYLPMLLSEKVVQAQKWQQLHVILLQHKQT